MWTYKLFSCCILHSGNCASGSPKISFCISQYNCGLVTILHEGRCISTECLDHARQRQQFRTTATTKCAPSEYSSLSPKLLWQAYQNRRKCWILGMSEHLFLWQIPVINMGSTIKNLSFIKLKLMGISFSQQLGKNRCWSIKVFCETRIHSLVVLS